MKIKFSHFLLVIAAVVLFSSCLSIDKRLYRSGYHIEWLTKNKTNPLERTRPEDAISFSDSVSYADTLFNSSMPVGIADKKTSKEITKPEPVSKEVYPRKIERPDIPDPKPARSEEDDGNGDVIKLLIMLLLCGGLVLTVIQKWVAWFVLAGLISFFILMLYIAFSKPVVSKNDPEAGDAGSDTKNKMIPGGVFISLLLGVLACLSYLYFYGAVTIFFTIAGSLFSADAIRKIRKDRTHKKGLALAIIAYILNMASLLFLIDILATYMEIFI